MLDDKIAFMHTTSRDDIFGAPGSCHVSCSELADYIRSNKVLGFIGTVITADGRLHVVHAWDGPNIDLGNLALLGAATRASEALSQYALPFADTEGEDDE